MSEYTDEMLLRRAVRGARDCGHPKGDQYPRWVGVMSTFGLGSTSAEELCRRFGLDPEELVG